MARKDMLKCIYVLTMLVVLTGKFAQCFEYEVSSEERLIFGKMTTFMETNSHVYHMVADEYIPGNILFSDQHSLKTTDGVTMTSITGSPTTSGYQNGIGVQAEFNSITGFLQVTPIEVIIVDHHNHCIRWLDRRNASVSDFAGECKEKHHNYAVHVDGMGTTARFFRPASAIQDTRNTNQVFISDSYFSALRVLDVKTASVSTLLKADILNHPRAFTYDPTDEDTLMFTTSFGIQKLYLPVLSRTDISGGTMYGFKDGSLKDARYRLCRQILPLHDQIYFVSDHDNHRLRVLDLLNDKVFSICTGIGDHLDGPVSECKLRYPSSLLLIGNNLYIGTESRIRSLPVSLEKIEVLTTTTTAKTPTTTTTPNTRTSPTIPTTLTTPTTPTTPVTPTPATTPRTTKTRTTPTTPAINSPLYSAISETTKTSTSVKSTAFQPTKTSGIGGDQMPREKTPLESTEGVPAAEPGKNNTLVIGVSVPLLGVLICVLAAFIAFAIRKRENQTSGTQSTSNVCIADHSQLSNNNSGTSQGHHSVFYSRRNEMSGLKERPPSYKLNYEDPVPSTLTPHAQANPENIYEHMDPLDPYYISFQNHSDQTLDNRA